MEEMIDNSMEKKLRRMCKCGHLKEWHIGKSGCNYGRWGRRAYPCLCYRFREVKNEKSRR